MRTKLAPTSSDLSLLPRADLPVIWDGFAAKAEQLRTTAETLTVTTIEQKAEMELARTTRLTLKQIRVEVEKKRVELGEGHLTEIQKINGAAKKIKEMIEPLEARLLEQETFAERAEKKRVAELAEKRAYEIRAVSPGRAFNPHQHVAGMSLGNLAPETYDAYITQLRAEAAEIAEAKRKQAEAEAALAARVAEEKRLRDEQARAFLAQQAEAQRQAREVEARFAAERAEAEEKFRQEQAEKDRQRDEELKVVEAKRHELEVQLAIEVLAKKVEETRLFKLALAPDVEQLRAFSQGIYNLPQPSLKTEQAKLVLEQVSRLLTQAMLTLDVFCKDEI